MEGIGWGSVSLVGGLGGAVTLREGKEEIIWLGSALRVRKLVWGTGFCR